MIQNGRRGTSFTIREKLFKKRNIQISERCIKTRLIKHLTGKSR